MESSTPFSSNASHGLWVITITLIVTSVVLALYGGQLDGPQPTDTDTYSRGAIGHRALYELFTRLGHAPVRLTQLQHSQVAAPLFFLEPRTKVRHQGRLYQLSSILKNRHKRGLHSVVAMPKWRVIRQGRQSSAKAHSLTALQEWLAKVLPHGAARLRLSRAPDSRPSKLPTHQASTTSQADQHPFVMQRVEVPLREGFDRTSGTFRGKTTTRILQLPRPQSFVLHTAKAQTTRQRAPGPTPQRKQRIQRIQRRQRIQVVLGRVERAYIVRFHAPQRGDIWLISDPDLLHNFNIHRGQQAALWATMASQWLGHKRLWIDECFHGHAKELSLAQELGRFPQVLLVLQALLLLGLFGWRGARRFGAPHHATIKQERGPRELINMTAWVLVCGQRIEQVAHTYITRVLQDLTDHTGASKATPLTKKRSSAPKAPKETSHTHDAQATQKAADIDALALRKGVTPDAIALQAWLDAPTQSTREALHYAHRAWRLRREILNQKIEQ